MNKNSQSVRNRRGSARAKPAADRRILRTRRSVVLALIDLVSKKRYEAITIQDLLDRADIGRSTFYAHYRGKDDLLLTSFRQMLEGLDACLDADPEAESRVAPVRELFRHVADARAFFRAIARSRIADRVYQAGADQLSWTIARRVGADPPAPAEVHAQALAGALFALLRWWVDRDFPHSPEEMDRMYHAIAAAGKPAGSGRRTLPRAT